VKRVAILIPLLCSVSLTAQVRISVAADRPVRTMLGGMGASWHAIEDPKAGKRPDGGMLAGSAWGANPPADDARAWKELTRHADWLGLDWCRVEVEQRMYEPKRREFSWDNDEMRILYRILDWAEKRGVDVFLQQMWSGTHWNAYPELRPSLLGRLISAPLSMDDFAYGLGEFVEHLTRVKKYRSIKWLSINNEPGYNWSWWQGPDGKPLPITPGLAAARKELDRRGISLPLSGPDWTDLPELVPSKIDFNEHIGAYDIHSYFANFDGGKGGYPLSTAEARLRRWAYWAHSRKKPFFLSEVGTMVFGWRDSNPGPGSYESGVKDASLVVRGIRAGVDGFNRWSFTNRGDLDGQWQLVDTWDIESGKLRTKFTPHPNAYYLYGLLSRFTAKGSTTMPVSISPGYSEKERQLVATALKSPKGQFSLLVVNEREEDVPANFTATGLAGGVKLNRYRMTLSERDRADVSVRPAVRFAAESFADTVPRMSVTVYTTYNLKPFAAGITLD
jgi:hypothetical protein